VNIRRKPKDSGLKFCTAKVEATATRPRKEDEDGTRDREREQQGTTNMTYEGTIVMYHSTKFWGFVRGNDGGEWFFHLDNCASGFEPQLSASIEFEIGPPISLGKKDQAVNVRPSGGAL